VTVVLKLDTTTGITKTFKVKIVDKCATPSWKAPETTTTWYYQGRTMNNMIPTIVFTEPTCTVTYVDETVYGTSFTYLKSNVNFVGTDGSAKFALTPTADFYTNIASLATNDVFTFKIGATHRGTALATGATAYEWKMEIKKDPCEVAGGLTSAGAVTDTTKKWGHTFGKA